MMLVPVTVSRPQQLLFLVVVVLAQQQLPVL
jgi:hypothetical protein